MIVEELIEKLQKLDPKAEVIIGSTNPELNGANVSVTYVYPHVNAQTEKRLFRDMMDGELYQREIWSLYGDGNLTVVLIS